MSHLELLGTMLRNIASTIEIHQGAGEILRLESLCLMSSLSVDFLKNGWANKKIFIPQIKSHKYTAPLNLQGLGSVKGIYLIRCLGNYYVGESIDVARRITHHAIQIHLNCHENYRIRMLSKLAHIKMFEFSIVTLCEDNYKRKEQEKKMICILKNKGVQLLNINT